MSEIETQARICPVCHDDHLDSQPHRLTDDDLVALLAKHLAEIVEYLRDIADFCEQSGEQSESMTARTLALRDAAKWIEQGDHLKGDTQ